MFILVSVLPLEGSAIPFLPQNHKQFSWDGSLLKKSTDYFSYNPWNQNHAVFTYHTIKQGNSKLEHLVSHLY